MGIQSPIPREKLGTLPGKSISELLTDRNLKEKKVDKSTHV